MAEQQLRLASEDDIPQLTAMRDEASGWLAERGIEQWTSRWDAKAAAKLAAAVAEERTWVVADGPQVAATVTTGEADPDFWLPADDLKSAFYVYRLTVARFAAGQRLGEYLLDWVGHRAEVEGRRLVRLDCWRTNTGLHRFYEKCGFEHIRTVEAPGRMSGALFQRGAKVRTYAGSLTFADLRSETRSHDGEEL